MLCALKGNALACMCLLFELPWANSALAQSLHVGVKAGANISRLNLYGYPVKDYTYSWRPDFLVGGIATYSTNQHLAIQAELMYSRKRTQQVNNNVVSSFSYVSLPLLLSYRVVGGWSVEVGPEFDYLLDAKLARNGIFDKAKSVAWVLNAGIIHRFQNSIGLGFRYGYGLGSVADPVGVTDSHGNQIGTIKVRNQTVQLTIAYLFR